MDIFFNFPKKNKGFLMIDAIVAVVIVTVALVALSYLYTQGTKAGIMAGSSERAMLTMGMWA